MLKNTKLLHVFIQSSIFLLDEIQQTWDRKEQVGQHLLNDLSQQRLDQMSEQEYLRAGFFQMFNSLDPQLQEQMLQYETHFRVKNQGQFESYLLDENNAQVLRSAQMVNQMHERLHRMINFQNIDLIEIPFMRFERLIAEDAEISPPEPEIPSKDITDILGGPKVQALQSSKEQVKPDQGQKIISFLEAYKRKHLE